MGCLCGFFPDGVEVGGSLLFCRIVLAASAQQWQGPLSLRRDGGADKCLMIALCTTFELSHEFNEACLSMGSMELQHLRGTKRPC